VVEKAHESSPWRHQRTDSCGRKRARCKSRERQVRKSSRGKHDELAWSQERDSRVKELIHSNCIHRKHYTKTSHLEVFPSPGVPPPPKLSLCLRRWSAQHPDRPVCPAQHNLPAQRSEPNVRELGRVALEREALLPRLVLEHAKVRPGASEELARSVESEGGDLTTSGSRGRREGDRVEEGELSEVEDADGRVGRVGDGEMVAVFGKGEGGDGAAGLVRKVGRERGLVPDVEDSDRSIDRSTPEQEPVRMDGDGRVRVRALARRKRLVSLDDRPALEVVERARRVGRGGGDVGLGRVKGETGDLLLGRSDLVRARPLALVLPKDLDFPIRSGTDSNALRPLLLPERDVVDLLGVALEGSDGLGGGSVVYLDDLVVAASEDEVSVGRDVEGGHTSRLRGVHGGDGEGFDIGRDGFRRGVAGGSLALLSSRHETVEDAIEHEYELECHT
jgi:hypothetical protein